MSSASNKFNQLEKSGIVSVMGAYDPKKFEGRKESYAVRGDQ